MGDSNPAVSPYLHPLQIHKVREYVFFFITSIVIAWISVRRLQTDAFLIIAAATIFLFGATSHTAFRLFCWTGSFHFQDC